MALMVWRPTTLRLRSCPPSSNTSGNTGWLWTGATTDRLANTQKFTFNLLKRLQAYAHIPLTFLNGLFLQQLVDTTVELANKVGAAEIISRIVDDLKDEAEQYRKMVMETIEKIMGNLGAADIDHKLEEQLIDGILYAFQEQTTEVSKGDHTGFITSCKKKKIYCVQFLSKSFQDGRNPLYKMFVLLT